MRQALRFLAAALVLGTTTCSTLEKKPAPRQCELSSDCADTEVCKSGRCEDASKDPPLSHLGFDIEERTGQEIFRAQIWGCDHEVVDAMEGREIRITRGEVAQRFELQVHAIAGVDVDNPQPGDLLPADLVLSQGGRFGRLAIARDGIEHPPVAEETQTVGSSVVPWPRYHLFDAMLPPAHLVWETRPETGASVVRMFRPPQTAGPRECTVDGDCCNGEGCDPAPNFCDLETGRCAIGCRGDLDCCTGSGCEPTPPNFCVGDPVSECTLIGNPSFLYAYQYDPTCNRSLQGDVFLVDLQTGALRGDEVAGAAVRLRHADIPGEPVLGVFDSSLGDLSSLDPECDPDDKESCGSADLVCDPSTSQCMLALAGRDAGSATTNEPTGPGEAAVFDTKVYTYCEGRGGEAFGRAFTLQVTPPTGRALPSVNLEGVTSVTPTMSGILRLIQPAGGPGRLCVPDWGAPTILALALEGAPRQLVDDTSAFRCCDVGCLPATADVVDAAPMNSDTCSGSTSAGVQPSVTLVTTFELDDEEREVWDQADCLPPVDGVIGRLSRKADCTKTTCAVPDLAAGDDKGPRVYDVRVESPVGSVLGSKDDRIEIAANATPAVMPVIELPPRVLVRGQVDVGETVCARRDDPEDDCASQGAVVLAERLAMPGETSANTPGPFLHQVSTFHDPIAGRDGAFVLPLDPGVWVLTALPTGDNDGGPAGFTVLDLRESVAPDPLQLQLEEGVLVTLNLRTFDRRSTVAPLDLGSWQGLSLPGDPEITFDLNATTTCLTPTGDPVQGCRIRQLVPPGASLTLTQVGLAFFTARQPANAASATCGTGG